MMKPHFKGKTASTNHSTHTQRQRERERERAKWKTILILKLEAIKDSSCHPRVGALGN
jgi:hypothetical protein